MREAAITESKYCYCGVIVVVVTTELALWEEFERVGVVHALGKTGFCQQGSSEHSHTSSEGQNICRHKLRQRDYASEVSEGNKDYVGTA